MQPKTVYFDCLLTSAYVFLHSLNQIQYKSHRKKKKRPEVNKNPATFSVTSNPGKRQKGNSASVSHCRSQPHS